MRIRSPECRTLVHYRGNTQRALYFAMHFCTPGICTPPKTYYLQRESHAKKISTPSICDSTQLTSRVIPCNSHRKKGVKMQYPDDDEIASSTILQLQGSEVKYTTATLDSFPSVVHNRRYTRQKTYTKAELRALTPQRRQAVRVPIGMLSLCRYCLTGELYQLR